MAVLLETAMKWLNLEIATLHSETYIGEDPVGRSTWISLLTYCAEQENGGLIAECADWKDRKWQQVMGVTLDEVKRPSGLWTWERGGLRVWKYPVEKEREIAQKRQAAANTNRMRIAGPDGVAVPVPPKRESKSDNFIAERGLLSHLNAATGKSFRAVDSNLRLIHARLSEEGVTVDGVKQMVNRQVLRWKSDPKMCEYLRPETLFNKTKFDSYYAAREAPIPQINPRPDSPGAISDRCIAGDGQEYVEAGKKY